MMKMSRSVAMGLDSWKSEQLELRVSNCAMLEVIVFALNEKTGKP